MPGRFAEIVSSKSPVPNVAHWWRYATTSRSTRSTIFPDCAPISLLT